MSTVKRPKKHWFIKCNLIILGTIGAIILGCAVNLKSTVFIEAGTEFKPADVWTTGIKLPVTIEEKIDTTVMGSRRCKIKIMDLATIYIQIEVRDTLVPDVTTQNIELNYGEGCKPEDFIASAKDVSDISYTFIKEPDYSVPGEQEVLVQAMDAQGNGVIVRDTLVIKPIRATYIIGLGDAIPDASAFVIDNAYEASYSTQPESTLSEMPGDYPVNVLIDGKEENLILRVVDNIAPIVEVTNLRGWTHKETPAQDFVVNVQDHSETTTSYKTQPDFTKEGEQDVIIVVKDAAGNATEMPAKITIAKDDKAPNITTSYIKVTVNNTLSYKKNITLSDNCDKFEDIKMEIDNSQVDLSNVGQYTVICTATDTAGNCSQGEIVIDVVEQGTEVHTVEEINALADAVLAEIIDDSMTLEEKAYAIYVWSKTNVRYISWSDKGDWMRGAYEGLALRKGDCFVFAATAKALLERIGVNPIPIKKEKTEFTTSSNHFWLLVDLGEGLYHYDTTPRTDGTWIFMWSDARLLEYSNSHRYCHNFTRSLYPEIQ